jgi:acyl-CoA synthetase (AMP-forming)/AMP-acid ligase II
MTKKTGLDLMSSVWTNNDQSKIGHFRSLIRLSQRTFPNNVFLVPAEDELTPMTYSDVFEFCKHFEFFLNKNEIGKGDAIAYMFHNSSLLVLLFLATLYTGRIFVPINPSSSPNEVDYILSDVKPSYFFYDKRFAEKLSHDFRLPISFYEVSNHKEFIDSIASGQSGTDQESSAGSNEDFYDPDQVAEIVYTSGTTGDPKGVVLTHKNLLANSYAFGRRFGFSSKEKFLTVCPLFHNSGQQFTTIVPVWCGARTTAVRSDIGLINFWHYVETFSITHTLGMPAHIFFLLEQPFSPETTTLKRMLVGGAKLPPETQVTFEDRFGVSVSTNYGLTETFSVIATEGAEIEDRYLGSIGKPLDVMDVKIEKDGIEVPTGAEGEIVVRGPSVFKCYLNKPDATRKKFKGDWFYTGDKGYLNSDGFLFMVDRFDSMILVGGENVYPNDIEKHIPMIPIITQGVLSSIPHPILGNELVLLYARVSEENLTKKILRDCFSKVLSAHKIPKQFVDIEELGLSKIPTAANGKILRKKIRDLLVDFLT